MRKTIAILLLAAMLAVFAAGCSLKKDEAPKSVEDVDPTSPILTIGDQNISFAIYKALYDSYLPYMQSSGYDPLESVSALESFQDWLVDSLSRDLVVLHQAESNGFTLTEEQEQELAKQTEEELKELYDTYYEQAEQDHEDDPSIPAEVYFEDYISYVSKLYTGTEMSWEDYQKAYAEEARRSFIIESYKDKVCEEFVPTTQDVTDWYDSQYTSNKTTYTDYPSRYKTDEEYYEKYFGIKDGASPVLYVPSGYSRIMDIVVSPKGELSEQYNTDIARMAEIKAEYSDLAFEDAVAGTDNNTESMAALIEEYNTLKASTDAEYASYTAAAHDKIEKAYAALQSGQPFAQVMMDYTEDTVIIGDEDYEGCAAFREKGRLISLEHASSGDWSDTVKAEFDKLKKGEHSGVFMDGDSYRIIYYVSDEKAGDVQLNDVFADIKTLCAETAKDSQWEDIVDEWLNDPELVKNEQLIRLLGLADVKQVG